MPKPIVISILADAGGVGKGVGEAETFLGRLTSKAAHVAKMVGVATVTAGVAIAGVSISAASEAEQSIGATEQVYGQYADTVIAKSQAAADAVGLSANSYREMSTVLGAMLKNAGTPMGELAGQTDRLIGLGADLAATFGGTTSDAVAALSSLMRGEADPIERYGVSIKQSDVNARMAAEGLTGLEGQALKTAEANTRLAILFEQTADASGQFGREATTLAGQQQRLTAQLDNAKVALGERFLPAATAVVGFLASNLPSAFDAVDQALTYIGPAVDVAGGALAGMAQTVGPALLAILPYIGSAATAVGQFALDLGGRLLPAAQTVLGWVGEFGPPAFDALVAAGQRLQPVVSGVADVLLAAGSALSSVIGFMDQNRAVVATLAAGYVAYRAILVGTAAAGWAVYLWQSRAVIMGATHIAVTKGMATAQLLLNTAMKANPLGLVIAGITLLVGGVMLAWKHSETFRNVVTGAFNAVLGAGQALWTGIQTGAQWVGTAIGTVVGLVQGYVGMWVTAFGLVVDAGMALYNGVATAVGWLVDGIGVYVNLIQGYIGFWVGAFQSVVTGAQTLYNKVSGSIASVASTIGGVKDKVVGALTGAGEWLKDAGKKVIDGFINGITDKFNAVKNTLGDLTSKLTSWKGPEDLDRRILRGSGHLVIDGFIAGLADREPAVEKQLGDLTGRLVEAANRGMALTPTLDVKVKPKAESWGFDPFDPTAGAGGATVQYITLEVKADPTTDRVALGRELARALDAYRRAGGRV